MTGRRDLCIMACAFCRDPLFQAWLGSMAGAMGLGDEPFDEAGAKEFILVSCGIDSRNELDTNAGAAERFHQMVRTPFVAWKEQQAGAGADTFYSGQLGEPWEDRL